MDRELFRVRAKNTQARARSSRARWFKHPADDVARGGQRYVCIISADRCERYRMETYREGVRSYWNFSHFAIAYWEGWSLREFLGGPGVCELLLIYTV